MNLFLMCLGIIILVISKIVRITRTISNGDKYFDGSTITESTLQWLGVLIFILGIFV